MWWTYLLGKDQSAAKATKSRILPDQSQIQYEVWPSHPIALRDTNHHLLVAQQGETELPSHLEAGLVQRRVHLKKT